MGFSGPDEIARKNAIYREAFANRKAEDQVGFRPTEHLAALCATIVLDDREGSRGRLDVMRHRQETRMAFRVGEFRPLRLGFPGHGSPIIVGVPRQFQLIGYFSPGPTMGLGEPTLITTRSELRRRATGD